MPTPTPELAARAEERFDAARAAAGARDPRPYLRERMVALRGSDPEAYRTAAAYHADTLIPAVAAAGSDPLGEWLEFARVLAALTTPGRAVQIDPSGRSAGYRRPVPPDALVLHLPEDAAAPALYVGVPPEPSRAQRAAIDLLVKRREAPREP
jgi:hypothetical protein